MSISFTDIQQHFPELVPVFQRMRLSHQVHWDDQGDDTIRFLAAVQTMNHYWGNEFRKRRTVSLQEAIGQYRRWENGRTVPMNKSTLSRLETGQTPCDPLYLAQFIDRLGVPDLGDICLQTVVDLYGSLTPDATTVANVTLALEAAHEAGKYLFERDPSSLVQISPPGQSLRLQADVDSQAIIDDILAGSPSQTISEENPENLDALLDSMPGIYRRWISDSLDGTILFSKGQPLYCTQLAHISFDHDGRIVDGIAVIYSPETECFFVGTIPDGGGVILDQRRSSVHRLTPSTVEAPHGAVLAVHFAAGDPIGSKEFCQESMPRLSSMAARTQALGCGGVAFSWIANGMLDCWVQKTAKLHDLIPGFIISQAAGAAVCDASGNDFTLRSVGVIAAGNRSLLETFKRLL